MTKNTVKTKTAPIALITSCTSTRTRDPIVRIEKAPEGTMEEVCAWWVGQLDSVDSKEHTTPGKLYRGAAMETLAQMGQIVSQEDIYVVTGGQGLIGMTQPIVPYDFTSDKKAPHNVVQKVTMEKFVPSVWWQRINSVQFKTPTPITDLLERYDTVVGALPKSFIKYIVHDLTTALQKYGEGRIYIPIPVSMLTSFPKQVRSCLVCYGKHYADDVSFARTNKAQAVASKFLRQAVDSGGFDEVAVEWRNNAVQSAEQTAIDYTQLFKDNPDLLEVDSAETAYRMVRARGITCGARQQFYGEWLAATNPTRHEFNKDQMSSAMDALDTVMAKARPQASRLDTDLLKKVELFVSAVKERDATFTFTARDVAEWGKKVFKEGDITSSSKLGGTLQHYASYLGIENISIPGESVKAYRLK